MSRPGCFLFLLFFLIACERDPVAPPRALFLSNRQNVEINEVIRFTDRSRGAIHHHWDFGDGSMSEQQNPGHFYTQGGEYRVVLTVENDLGSDDTSRIIRVSSPDILWPAPGNYSGYTGRDGIIELTITDKNIDQFKGSFFASIAGEVYQLNSSFEFGVISKTDSGFVASYNGNVLTGNFRNDTITGIWKHQYGQETYRIQKP